MAPRTPWFRNGASSACAKAPLATQSTVKAMRAVRIIAAILYVNGVMILSHLPHLLLQITNIHLFPSVIWNSPDACLIAAPRQYVQPDTRRYWQIYELYARSSAAVGRRGVLLNVRNDQ